MSDVGLPLRAFEPDIAASNYQDTFHQHLASVQIHLKGQLNDDEPLLPSYLPPTAYWTAKEKDLFFHGLRIYSRLRPDLIAAHIKTKNTIEVSLYLHCLHAAVAENLDDISEEAHPPAMEVSEKWIKHEEVLVETMKGLDSCSWRADRDGVQDQSSCTCPSITTDIADSVSKANAYLNHLDSVCLMTQESIIREPMVKSQDMRLQAQMASLEESAQGGPSTHTWAQDQLDYLEDLCLEDANKFSSLGSANLQNMVENDQSLTNDKKLQRQLKKRLYMRRKRAEQSGKPVDPISIRLRPGREQKARKPSKPRPTKYNTKNKAEVDSHQEDIDNMYEAHSKGGATRPYRVKKVFQESGIDAQMLSNMDLDLFHLSTITRLLRLYNSLNDIESSLDTVSISAWTIQLFSDVTKEFVAEIIRRAVVTKEQEIRMKRLMPVWKYERDEITIENIAECLYSMGLGHLNKEKYFEALLGPQDPQEMISPAPSNVHVQETNEQINQESVLNLSKDQVFRTLQHTLPQSMSWCSLPNLRELFSTDEILSDEINIEEVDKQLEDDEALNVQDESISADYELSLWNTY